MFTNNDFGKIPSPFWPGRMYPGPGCYGLNRR